MKPLVYFVDKVAKDNYVLSKEELSRILEEVYQAGYDDGYQTHSRSCPYIIPGKDNFDTTQEWWKRVTCQDGIENKIPLSKE